MGGDQPWGGEVEPVGMGGGAVDAQHRTSTFDTVIQVMQLDAIDVDEVAAGRGSA
jgi:hypothetical protein